MEVKLKILLENEKQWKKSNGNSKTEIATITKTTEIKNLIDGFNWEI